MKNKISSLAFCSLFLILINTVSAQVSGFINRAATISAGRLIFDPNGDGYTSKTTAGFGTNDVTNSEIPYTGIRAYSIEPFGDLRRGPNHGFSDFVPDSSGNGVYFYFTPAQQILFRMRMGSVMPGSKGYSILMDTDGKFGATGANADPNYIASTTGTNGNPGFEIEIVLETNFRIAIYNVDGTSSPTLIKQYTNWQDMSEVSIAATNDNGDPDFFIDFYIPFSDLQAAPFNLTTSSSIRMTATTVMSPQAAIGGPRSDIYGTAGDSYEDFIDGQPGCSIFNTAPSCPTAMCTKAPIVNSPINTGSINITGTWIKSALPGALSTATITVYKNGGAIGTITNVSSTSTWTLNSITLINGDIITAKAQATGESMCLISNAVPSSTCNTSNLPATPILNCTTGSKGIGANNLSSGWTVNVNNITRNVPDNNVTNATTLFGANTGTSPNITWIFSGGCSTGAPLTSGSYKVYYTDNVTGCISLPSYFCAAGNGGSALAGSLTVPVFTSPANSVFTVATKTISGTTDPNATVSLYINSIRVQTVAATAGGIFTFSGLNLLNGQQLYLAVELNTGTVSTSKCAAQTALFTVSCYTNPPLINGDNNNQLTAGAVITGTCNEPTGTTIKVYNSVNTLLATTTVQANGSWSTGNVGTLPATYNAVAGTSYYASAQNGSCGLSDNSASYTAATGTTASRCGNITGPITSGVTSISGTVTGTIGSTTVNLYLDGQLIGSTVTPSTAWGPIAVNTTANNTLYSNGVLSLGIQESGSQEVICPSSGLTISCSPTPAAPSITPINTSINQYQTVTYTISNSVSGSFYAIADSATGASLGKGTWSAANGSLNLITDKFNTAGSFKVFVKSTSLSGVTLCSAVSLTGTVVVNTVILPLTLIDFKGSKDGKNIILEWKTVAENELNRFEIERSEDGIAYSRLGQELATGIGSSEKQYTFTDFDPLQKVAYYRLKMIDNDGRFTYSKFLVFTNNKASTIVLNNVSPNPFRDAFTISMTMEKAQITTVQLVDVAGRIIYTKYIKTQIGINKVLISDIGKLQAGMYFLKIKTEDDLLLQRIIKQ